jgi:hypothetical protein
MISLTGLVVGIAPLRQMTEAEEQEWLNSKSEANKQDDPVITKDGNDDHEGSMAKAQLMAIQKQAAEMFDMIKDSDELEAWVQDKISKASHYIEAIHKNLNYQKNGNTKLAKETAPTGWGKTVEKMKNNKDIDNPFALSYWMKQQGYKPQGK